MTDEELPRLWKEEGRQFAYIKDVFDKACEGKNPTDIIIYTNADIHCRNDCRQMVHIYLNNSTACFAYRRDFARLDAPLRYADYELGLAYAGSDLAAFKVIWWRIWRSHMADMILGLEAWDPIFRTLVQITNPGKKVDVENVIGHERHNSYWERKENRHRLRGQQYCRTLARQWLQAHGINPAIHGL